jgi:hypothetical protein
MDANIILGSYVIEKFYSVYDLDRKEIRCGFRFSIVV